MPFSFGFTRLAGALPLSEQHLVDDALQLLLLSAAGQRRAAELVGIGGELLKRGLAGADFGADAACRCFAFQAQIQAKDRLLCCASDSLVSAGPQPAADKIRARQARCLARIASVVSNDRADEIVIRC